MTISISSIYLICKSIAHDSTATRERRHRHLSSASGFATNEIMARAGHTRKRVDEIGLSRDLLGQPQPYFSNTMTYFIDTSHQLSSSFEVRVVSIPK